MRDDAYPGPAERPRPTPEWEAILDQTLRGLVMVVGAPDTGKSTFARYLYEQLCARGEAAAFLDGDPGQASLGPPSTLTLATGPLDRPTRVWRWFIGAVSPRGHMLPLLVGAARLIQAARQAGADTIVYDTDGLIDPAQGGLNLKLALIDLLQPRTVFAIQTETELQPLLQPLSLSRRTEIIPLAPSPAVRRRDPSARQEHRARQFAAYFREAGNIEMDWDNLALLPGPTFSYHQLLALEDSDGFCLSLGILLEADLARKRLRLLTPLASTRDVDALRLGDLSLAPQTFRDEPIFKSAIR